jgi:hypothetical protein
MVMHLETNQIPITHNKDATYGLDNKEPIVLPNAKSPVPNAPPAAVVSILS